ncbi:MAG: ABC transporter permease, partial [Chloroflexi bacterium]|nr:ABC transporter permease [Chloroflexota bacterium]
ARVSLGVGLAATLLAASVGVVTGLVAGYFEGFLDAVLMRIVDVLLALPAILFGIAVMVVLGPSIRNVVIVLTITGWVGYARVVRGTTLSLKHHDFVLSAEAIGCGSLRIMVRHILPNTVAGVLVLSTFQVASMIVAEASLSFLGVGVPPPFPSWGAMLSDGKVYIASAWWLAALPGLALTVAVLAINQLGDGLRDLLDPRLRGTQ